MKRSLQLCALAIAGAVSFSVHATQVSVPWWVVDNDAAPFSDLAWDNAGVYLRDEFANNDWETNPDYPINNFKPYVAVLGVPSESGGALHFDLDQGTDVISGVTSNLVRLSRVRFRSELFQVGDFSVGAVFDLNPIAQDGSGYGIRLVDFGISGATYPNDVVDLALWRTGGTHYVRFRGSVPGAFDTVAEVAVAASLFDTAEYLALALIHNAGQDGIETGYVFVDTDVDPASLDNPFEQAFGGRLLDENGAEWGYPLSLLAGVDELASHAIFNTVSSTRAEIFGVQQVVPLPPAAWLLGTAVVGLLAAARRRPLAAGSRNS